MRFVYRAEIRSKAIFCFGFDQHFFGLFRGQLIDFGPLQEMALAQAVGHVRLDDFVLSGAFRAYAGDLSRRVLFRQEIYNLRRVGDQLAILVMLFH